MHGVTAILPGVLLAYLTREAAGLGQDYVALLLFFGVLTVLMFQAVGIYSEELFSSLLRFRITFFAWSAAFCLLLFMHQALGLFQYVHLSCGVLQGSCRVSRIFYAAIFSVGCSLSGLSVTVPMGCQLRVAPDQRCGF